MDICEDPYKKLLPYQIPHVNRLLNCLKLYNRALDASDTGTGKTYSAIATCLLLNLKPFIICPKSVINSWITVMGHFDKAPHYGIANYELIKNCRYYNTITKERTECPYVDTYLTKNKKGEKVRKYKWKFPDDVIIIFDESHRCKNVKTQNSELLFSLSHYPHAILMLSATACDTKKDFKLYGYVLGLYSALDKANTWIYSIAGSLKNPMKEIHEYLFPTYGSRMRIRDISNQIFKGNDIRAECLEMKTAPEIQKQWELIGNAVNMLQEKQNNAKALGMIIRARQRIEMLKVPTFIKVVRIALKKGYSVAVFMNFTDSLKKVARHFKSDCFIYGEQSLDDRNQAIKNFNEDRERLIFCNIKAGGVGISLHDCNGNYPRMSVISPTWSAQDLIQVLGRIHRAEAKTDAIQLILFCDEKHEKVVKNAVQKKIRNIAILNDGDMQGYQIKGLYETEESDQPRATPFEKAFRQLTVLNIKRDRLKKELEQTEQEIKDLHHQLPRLAD